MKTLRNFLTWRMLFIMLTLFVGSVAIESCGSKNACGSKHQKKKRNKRIKKSTNFMTY